MSRIFISYSSKNRAIVDQLVTWLTNAGYDVHYDQQLETGQQWWDEILLNIQQCDIFIFALSPEYLDSYPCDLEYRYAQGLNRHLLPLMITPVNFGQVPASIALTQTQDLTRFSTDAKPLAKLIHILNKLAQTPLVFPSQMPPKPPAPINKLNVVIERVTNFSVALNLDEQTALLSDIRSFFLKRPTRDNACYALTRFRKRAGHDLPASIADEIDGLLEICDKESAPSPEPVRRWLLPLGVFGLVALIALIGVTLSSALSGAAKATDTPSPLLTKIAQNAPPTSRPTLPTLTATSSATVTPPKPTLPNTATNPPANTPLSAEDVALTLDVIDALAAVA